MSPRPQPQCGAVTLIQRFGSALNLTSDRTQVHRVGSLAYMSPEQLDGPRRSAELQREIAALPKTPSVRHLDGDGVIETYSVRYDWPVTTGIIVGRTDDGTRFMATSTDPELMALMTGGDPLGQRISVKSVDGVNEAALG